MEFSSIVTALRIGGDGITLLPYVVRLATTGVSYSLGHDVLARGSTISEVTVANGVVLASIVPFSIEKALAFWWVFPASVLFATIALAAGVSGALFFSPFFMLAVGLSPARAIGAGLLTEIAGMGNGLRSYINQQVVDYQTAKWLLAAAVPMVIVGAVASHFINPGLLKLVFGSGLVLLGGFLITGDSPENCEPGEDEGSFLRRKNEDRGTTVIATSDGDRFEYITCWRPPGVALASVGAFITGLISAGFPEVTTTQLIKRCRVPPRVAVATSVFVLAITAAVGAAVHALTAQIAWYVVIWSVPGVLVGSTIGTSISKYLPGDLMETALGGVFAAVGVLVVAVQLTA